MLGSPLLTLDHRDVRAEHLLALTPDAALVQLAQLRQVAEDALLPALSRRRGFWAVGPTFDGSEIINSDADLVVAGLLLEIKTVVGRKLKDGSRQAELDGDTIRQLLGYLLLDFSNRFEITELGLYSARYGHLATWDVRRLLEELAGRPVDLTIERAAFRGLLLADRGTVTARDVEDSVRANALEATPETLARAPQRDVVERSPRKHAGRPRALFQTPGGEWVVWPGVRGPRPFWRRLARPSTLAR